MVICCTSSVLDGGQGQAILMGRVGEVFGLGYGGNQGACQSDAEGRILAGGRYSKGASLGGRKSVSQRSGEGMYKTHVENANKFNLTDVGCT